MQKAFAATALIAIALIVGCEQPSAELRLVTPRLPVDREIAEQFASLLDEESSVDVTLVPSPDVERTALDALEAGAADIALVSNNEAYRPGVATVMPLYANVLHIAYLKEREVAGTRGLLDGSSVYAGPPGTPSRAILERAASRFGLEPEDIDYVQYADDCADVFVVFAPIMDDLPQRLAESGCGEYRLLSLGDPAEVGLGSVADSAALLNPRLQPFVIPKDTYDDITPEAVVTLAVDKLLVARDDVPEHVVYDLTSEILRLKPALSAIRPALFAELTDDFDLSDATFVMHRGAQAFLQRDAPSVYERYSGIAEVAVTLMIGLLSGGFAMVRIYRIRRKNRIDTFYAEAMSIRDRAQPSTDLAVRKGAVEELRALQNRAFDLLVDEKLAADESFRIFITLSNDIIADLGRD